MQLRQLLDSIADAGRELLNFNRAEAPAIAELCAELCTSKGEAMGTAIAQQLVEQFEAMNDSERLDFFQLLAREYSADPEQIIRCAESYKQDSSQANYQQLGAVVEGPRRTLFRGINMAPTGTATLLKMREQLLPLLKQNEELQAVEDDLLYLLKSWFNRGFLSLQTINWQSPAHILEKLIAYEAVHEMQGWDDLRRRLAQDRRCFAFFHPALPDEPLIFVQVALTAGLADNVQLLLAASDGETIEHADSAIFYSISNCQKGLQGVSFGNFLIKQVVMELRLELPQLKNFATLSPIPGFMRWLKSEQADGESTLLSAENRAVLENLSNDDWHRNETYMPELEPLMLRLCSHYLYEAKRGKQPLDPVQRFHLSNGARIERLNWLADTSDNGLKQSAAMLVNYGYELSKVEASHEAYVNEHRVVVSKEFQKLLD